MTRTNHYCAVDVTVQMTMMVPHDATLRETRAYVGSRLQAGKLPDLSIKKVEIQMLGSTGYEGFKLPSPHSDDLKQRRANFYNRPIPGRTWRCRVQEDGTLVDIGNEPGADCTVRELIFTDDGRPQ